MNAVVERKLSIKDADLRRFLKLAMQATGALPQDEDRRYVTNYVNGLLSGGKTWARADEHFVTGIQGTLSEIADQNERPEKLVKWSTSGYGVVGESDRSTKMSMSTVIATAQMLQAATLSTEAVLTLVFSGLVALSAVVYATLTWTLVAETRRMRRAQSDARVGVELVENSWSLGLVDLVVRNDGAGPATDIRFEIVETGSGTADPEITTRLNELTFIANGISYLSPGRDIRTYLGRVVGRTLENIKTHVHLRVRYRSATNENHENCYPIDLEQFWSRFRAGAPPLETIADELKAIRLHLSVFLTERSQGEGER